MRNCRAARSSLLLVQSERFSCGVHDRDILIHPAVVLDLTFVAPHGADIDRGIVARAIEITAQPSRDSGRFGTDGPVKQILPAGDLRHVDDHLRLRRLRTQDRDWQGEKTKPGTQGFARLGCDAHYARSEFAHSD
jgi:hypothetical protein